MNQELYEKIQAAKRRLIALKRRGRIHDFVMEVSNLGDASTCTICIQYIKGKTWVYYSLGLFLKKFRAGVIDYEHPEIQDIMKRAAAA